MKNLILAIVAIVFLHINLKAQVQDTFHFAVELINPVVSSNGDTSYTFKCVIDADDSLQVSAVQFDIGTYPGDNSVASQLFVVGQNYGLPNGYSVTTATNEITLGLGILDVGLYHYKVRLQFLNGSNSRDLVYNAATGQYTFLP